MKCVRKVVGCDMCWRDAVSAITLYEPEMCWTAGSAACAAWSRVAKIWSNFVASLDVADLNL